MTESTDLRNQVKATWIVADGDAPCPVCGKPDWCSSTADRRWAICRRIDSGSGRRKADKSGADYWVYRLDGGSIELGADVIVASDTAVDRAHDEDLDKVYRALLGRLTLAEHHRDDLRRRGLSDHPIEAGEYRSLPVQGRARLAQYVVEMFGPDTCARVPGLHTRKDGEKRWWTLAGAAGLVVPVRSRDGLIVALKVRADGDDTARYTYISSTRHGGSGPGARVHVPRGGPSQPDVLRITEGELKADTAMFLSDTPTISIPGVSCWRTAIPVIKSLNVARVILAFDADCHSNPNVARALARCHGGLSSEGVAVALETWPEENGKGIDDLLAGGGAPALHGPDEAGDAILNILRSAGLDDADDTDDGPWDIRTRIESLKERIDAVERLVDEPWLDTLLRLDDAGVFRAIAEVDRSYHVPLIDRLAGALGLTGDKPTIRSLSQSVKDALRTVELDRKEAAKVDKAGEPSAADLLIEIGSESELITDQQDESFAIFEIDDVRQVYPIASQQFTEYLSRELWNRHGKPAPDNALTAAKRVLSAKARYEGGRHSVHLRVARDGDVLWYDMADPNWRAIRIDARGWRVHARPGVLFRRHGKTSAQIVPAPGGHIDELRSLLHIADDDWYLLVPWLVAAFIEGAPHPVLGITGEHGASKTTLARINRRLIDPAVTELITPPAGAGEYAQSAHQAWVFALDNISHIPAWMSDALCRTVTGDAFEKRRLYTDDGAVLWTFRRVVILNGIGDIITRPDLLDRSILITLRRFEAGERLPETTFWSRFDAARPRILGALLDLTVATLRELAGVTVVPDVRMADFAKLGIAVERASGWPSGTFEDALVRNGELQVEQAIEASSVAQSVLRLLDDGTGSWTGTAGDLLRALRAIWDKEEGRLPTQPNRLSGELRRAAPPLRKIGVAVEFVRDKDRERTRRITIRRCQEGPSASSASSEHGGPRRETTDSAGPAASDSDGRRTMGGRSADDHEGPCEGSQPPLPTRPGEDAVEVRTVADDADDGFSDAWEDFEL